jgi:methyl-accepting chemotaxis protein
VKNLKVSTALSATLVLFVAWFMLTAVVVIWILHGDRQTIERLGRANIERASDLADLNSRLFQARAALAEAKIYMESGQEEPRDAGLKRANDLLEAARASTKRLSENPDGEPQGQPLFDAVMKTAGQLDGEVLDPLAKAVAGWNGIVANKITEKVLPDAGQHYVDAVDAYQAYARAQGREAVANASRVQQRAMTGALAALALLVVLAVLIRMMFHRTILRPLNGAGQHFDRIADGDLTGEVHVRGNNEIGVLYAAMARMQASLGKAVAAVRGGVEEIHGGTGEIAEAGNEMSMRSARQAEALQEAAGSLTQLANTVSSNAEQADKASQRVQEVAKLARQGGQAMDEAVSSMHGISLAAQRIAEIVDVVDGIAVQTNLLALNAAVEAARAGEQGRGFAVVAGEVRTLAQRSAQAAREIKDLIDDASGRVGTGERHVSQAGEAMAQLMRSVDEITEMMGQISAASAEQAQDLDTVNRTMATLDGATQEDSAMVEQTAAAAGALADQAQVLRNAVSIFKLEKSAPAPQAGRPAALPSYAVALPAAS